MENPENLYQSHWKTNAPSASSEVGNEKSADSLGRFGSLVMPMPQWEKIRNFSDMKKKLFTEVHFSNVVLGSNPFGRNILFFRLRKL